MLTGSYSGNLERRWNSSPVTSLKERSARFKPLSIIRSPTVVELGLELELPELLGDRILAGSDKVSKRTPVTTSPVAA
jgi:hypothetical protein